MSFVPWTDSDIHGLYKLLHNYCVCVDWWQTHTAYGETTPLLVFTGARIWGHALNILIVACYHNYCVCVDWWQTHTAYGETIPLLVFTGARIWGHALNILIVACYHPLPFY